MFFFNFKKYKHELPRLWKKILILVRIERKIEEAALKGGDWWIAVLKTLFYIYHIKLNKNNTKTIGELVGKTMILEGMI